ncbi:MAG TPA: acetoin utilization protein AcuC [Thermoplasmata archaeon]|nr:acetoin utilization protein AcuC [Thermoplasmata archaeon]
MGAPSLPGPSAPPKERAAETTRTGSAPRALVVWDPAFRQYAFGPDHPFTEATRDLAVRLLERSLLPDERSRVEWLRDVAPAEPPVLERFHEARYVARVRAVGAGDTTVYLDQGDTPGTPGCFEAAARIVAGAVRAAESAWEDRRPAFHPAGGLHHARPDRASGFCIFNDLSVALAGPLAAGRRIAYLDIDAHHGDGVMYGFYRSGRLLDIDFHQDGRTLFPGTGFPSEAGGGDGAGLKVNVPLPPGAGDAALLPLFRRIVPPMLDRFRPEMIVLQHGVDGHAGDPLAQLQYTPRAYEEIDRMLLAYAAEHCHGRLLVTGGGGYRAESVARVLARTGRILAGLTAPSEEALLPDAWRSDFFEETGYASPERWAERESIDPFRWSGEEEASLVAELESRTGVRFPAVGPERSP